MHWPMLTKNVYFNADCFPRSSRLGGDTRQNSTLVFKTRSVRKRADSVHIVSVAIPFCSVSASKQLCISFVCKISCDLFHLLLL